MSRATARRALPAITLSSDASGPIGRQLFRQLKDLIRTGRLRTGSRLPSTRQLAAELGVSRNVVVFAYEELRAESYIVSLVGAGSYVAASRQRGPPVPAARPIGSSLMAGSHRSPISVEPGFRIGEPFEIDLPAIDVFPRKLWAKIAADRYATSLRHLLSCAETGGYLPLRQTIAEHVRETRAIDCEPDQVIIVTGQGQAISLVSSLLIEAGDAAFIENPTRLGIRQILRAAGARLAAVSVDDGAFDIASACASAPLARLALVTPSSHFPLGFAMRPAARTALAEWASRQEGRWILEDDTGHDLTPPGSWQPPLWSFATGRVVYFSSFRPTLAPSLRLGFIIAPERLVDAMLSARALTDGYRAPLEQAILNDFVTAGHYAEHIRDMRQIYAERHAALTAAVAEHLPDIVLPGSPVAGLHTVCRLAPPLRDVELAARAGNRFVLRALSTFYEGATEANALLLGHAQMNASEIRREIRRLAAALR